MLHDEVNDLQLKLKGLSNASEVGSILMYHNTRTYETIPVHRLIIINVRLNGAEKKVLNDDSGNTNIVSKNFMKKFRHCFKLVDENIVVHHSEKDDNEKSSQIIIDVIIKIVGHT